MGRGRHTQSSGAGLAPRDLPVLDEQLMRRALAYEARVIEVNIEGYSRVPKALREMAAVSAENLRRAARGDGEDVYLHSSWISGRAAASLNAVIEAAEDPLAITACTDAENTLRLALAHEASQIDRMLEFSGFPRSRRRIAVERAAAMRLAAAGHPARAYAGQNARSFAGPLADLEADPPVS